MTVFFDDLLQYYTQLESEQKDGHTGNTLFQISTKRENKMNEICISIFCYKITIYALQECIFHFKDLFSNLHILIY